MIARGSNFKSYPLKIVGSSSFGRYNKISCERTINMLVSDNFLINYAGYETVVLASLLGSEGRALHTSTKLNKLVGVFNNTVYLINIFFDQNTLMTLDFSVIPIGTILTSTGVVYIAENNKPQIAISDGVGIYIYDPTLTPAFQQADINFTPGYIDFHDTYFLAAATNDNNYKPPATNTWRLSGQNDGLSWPSLAQNIGLIETKPDVTQAVVRFPSQGNLIIVMGSTVTEFWFDQGALLFPYQRNSNMTIDYGCLSPATIASMDSLIVWLGVNEKSGPVIIYTTGGVPKPISTDGIDYLFSQLKNPSDARAFLFRQDGHLIYHINFYTDNYSIFYDFTTDKIYNASDENGNYFIGHSVAYFNNQYYFVSKNNGNLYAFDTVFTTYDGHQIPRIRICQNIREPSQEYRICNDIGFTIETGETNYQRQELGPIFLTTVSGNKLVTTTGGPIFLQTMNGDQLITVDDNELVAVQQDTTTFDYLITVQPEVINTTPRVDLSISIDGGATFSSDFAYVLPPIGVRKNRLMWWQLGAYNDLVAQFRFQNFGRVIATDGIVNTRQ